MVVKDLRYGKFELITERSYRSFAIASFVYFGLEARQDVLKPRYLYYFCKKFDFERLNKAVTIPSLTKSDLLKIKINLPDIDQQQVVIDKLMKIEND